MRLAWSSFNLIYDDDKYEKLKIKELLNSAKPKHDLKHDTNWYLHVRTSTTYPGAFCNWLKELTPLVF